MFEEERSIEGNKYSGWRLPSISFYYYSTRQCIASAAWIANDFAFYGNKLQQGLFLNILYPAVRTGDHLANSRRSCASSDDINGTGRGALARNAAFPRFI